jgi:hypothetical protein
MNIQQKEMYIIFYEYLLVLRDPLVKFLSMALPRIHPNWWNIMVVPKLTEKQIRDTKPEDIGRLENVDITALLLILKHNWYEIEQKSRIHHGADYFQNRQKINTGEIKTIEKVIKIRDRIAHPNDRNISLKNFNIYMEDVIEFAKLIRSDKEIIQLMKAPKSVSA